MSEAIPRHVLSAAARSLRFKVLALLNDAFARSGLTEEAVAVCAGWPASRVRRSLRGTSRITLRSMAVLAFAIDGSVLEFKLDSQP